MIDPKAASIFITGGAGFLGKVVIEEMLRRRCDFGIDKIFILLRPKRLKSAKWRFENEISKSECFKHLPFGWEKFIEVVGGDLVKPDMGVNPLQLNAIAQKVTHIVHCAASIDFNLPILSAAKANIDASLTVLEFSKKCFNLQKMVAVSTAYVTPHQAGILAEELVPLKYDAEELYQKICNKSMTQEDALNCTGHPNTYTLTKCIAEHLLIKKCQKIPLVIVRPSIISVARKFPFDGWIDSTAALAGFVVTFASGYLRVVSGNENTCLDVVPVDEVAQCIIEQLFKKEEFRKIPIVHSVAGLHNALSIKLLNSEVQSYFERYPHKRRIGLAKMGPANQFRDLQHLMYHRGPLRLAQFGAEIAKQKNLKRQAKLLDKNLDAIYRIFPYFTHHTFDFSKTYRKTDVQNSKSYIGLICLGTHRYLMQQKPQQQKLKFNFIPTSAKGLFLNFAIQKIFREVNFNQFAFENNLLKRDVKKKIHVVLQSQSFFDVPLCQALFASMPQWNLENVQFSEAPIISISGEFYILPITLCYDIIPDNNLNKEHLGFLKSGKETSKILIWMRELLLKNQIRGGVMLNCGKLISCDSTSDLINVDRIIETELKSNSVVSEFQLKSLSLEHEKNGFDVEVLLNELIRRGAEIYASDCKNNETFNLGILKSRNRNDHWMSFFAADFARLLPANLFNIYVRKALGLSDIDNLTQLELEQPENCAALDATLQFFLKPILKDCGEVVKCAQNLLNNENSVAMGQFLKSNFCLNDSVAVNAVGALVALRYLKKDACDNLVRGTEFSKMGVFADLIPI